MRNTETLTRHARRHATLPAMRKCDSAALAKEAGLSVRGRAARGMAATSMDHSSAPPLVPPNREEQHPVNRGDGKLCNYNLRAEKWG